jgi:hypothetical protein
LDALALSFSYHKQGLSSGLFSGHHVAHELAQGWVIMMEEPICILRGNRTRGECVMSVYASGT